MAPCSLRCLDLRSPDATSALAAAIAPLLVPGDTILLNGEIGSGKTHFARALILTRLAAAGAAEEVPSPTYTLVQTYTDGNCEIWHADLYRLSGPAEVTELGLTEAFRNAICLIEWPDRLADLQPAGGLCITFEHTSEPERRIASVSWNAANWDKIIPALESRDV